MSGGAKANVSTPPPSPHSNWSTTPLVPRKSPVRLARRSGLGHGATQSLNIPRDVTNEGKLDLDDFLMGMAGAADAGTSAGTYTSRQSHLRHQGLDISENATSKVHDPQILSPRPRRHTDLRTLDTSSLSHVSQATNDTSVVTSDTPPTSFTRSNYFQKIQLSQPVRKHVRGARSLSPQRRDNMFAATHQQGPAPQGFRPSGLSAGPSHMPRSGSSSLIADQHLISSLDNLHIANKQGQRTLDTTRSPQTNRSSDLSSISDLKRPYTRPDHTAGYIVPSQEQMTYLLRSQKTMVMAKDTEAQLTWARGVMSLSDKCQARQMRLTQGVSDALTLPVYELRLEALNCIMRLNQQGVPMAQLLMGIMFEHGRAGCKEDRRAAHDLYLASARSGCARAEYCLGMLHEWDGNFARANQCYERGASKDDAACLSRLGLLVLLGDHGYERNEKKGTKCMYLSALEADVDAPQGAYIYGMMLCSELSFNLSAHTLEHNVVQALHFLQIAAKLGYGPAQLRLGKAHEYNELGCEFNPSMSVHYYTLAAQSNEPQADMALSKWYLAGSDDGLVVQDEQKAYVHADLAARQGLASAEFAMGYFHEVGVACEADIRSAQVYYNQAAEHGSEEARSRIVGIARSGTLSRRDHDLNVSTKIQARHATIKRNQSRSGQHTSQPPHQLPVPSVGSPRERGQKTTSPSRYNHQKSQSTSIAEANASSMEDIVNQLQFSDRRLTDPTTNTTRALPSTPDSSTLQPSARTTLRGPRQSPIEEERETRSWAPSSPQWSEMERTRPKYQSTKYNGVKDNGSHSRVHSWTQETSNREYHVSPNLAPSELSTLSEAQISRGSPRPESSVSNVPPFKLPPAVASFTPHIGPEGSMTSSKTSAESTTPSALKRAGPATFEEMGIPIANKKKEECTMM